MEMSSVQTDMFLPLRTEILSQRTIVVREIAVDRSGRDTGEKYAINAGESS